MNTATLPEFQADPLALLARVEGGESILLTRDGRPVAELRPVPPLQAGLRPFGLAAGEFVVPDDFDAPLSEDILRGFEGR